MAVLKAHIRRDDIVEVLAGRDRGKRGRVLRVYPRKARALVEGVNFITKATRPDARTNQMGGFVKKESLIHVSNLRKVSESARKTSESARKAGESARKAGESARKARESAETNEGAES
jgi:large subunit ribosomal protein L24